jgi:hypothetical protein
MHTVAAAIVLLLDDHFTFRPGEEIAHDSDSRRLVDSTLAILYQERSNSVAAYRGYHILRSLDAKYFSTQPAKRKRGAEGGETAHEGRTTMDIARVIKVLRMSEYLETNTVVRYPRVRAMAFVDAGEEGQAPERLMLERVIGRWTAGRRDLVTPTTGPLIQSGGYSDIRSRVDANADVDPQEETETFGEMSGNGDDAMALARDVDASEWFASFIDMEEYDAGRADTSAYDFPPKFDAHGEGGLGLEYGRGRGQSQERAQFGDDGIGGEGGGVQDRERGRAASDALWQISAPGEGGDLSWI